MYRILKIFGFLTLFLFGVTVILTLSIRKTIPNLDSEERHSNTGNAVEFRDAVEKSWVKLSDLRRDGMYPSVSIAVHHDGRLLWADATGYANIKDRTGVDTNTRYPIGSISKPITSTLVMKLVEDGRIDIDLPITRYASDLPVQFSDVTIRHLLSHQAGVRHYKFAWTPPFFTEFGLNKEFSSLDESIKLFIDDPLLFEPGTEFQYTTYGYTLIAYVLEQATDTSFFDLLNRYVLMPLDMPNTQADRHNPQASNKVDLYLALPKRLGVVLSPKTNPSHKWGGGGLTSTPTEIGRFGDAILHREFLNNAIFTEMTTLQKTRDGEDNPQGYGLGWRTGTMPYPRGSDDLVPIIHHGGTAAGSECALMLVPTFEMTVAICGNAFTGGSGGLVQLAADIARNFQETVDRE